MVPLDLERRYRWLRRFAVIRPCDGGHDDQRAGLARRVESLTRAGGPVEARLAVLEALLAEYGVLETCESSLRSLDAHSARRDSPDRPIDPKEHQ